MNFIRNMLASRPKEELVVIPSGELFLKRGPQSPKGISECLFKDSVATIRKTTTDFQYQLVIQRVYEEVEADLEDETGNDDDLDEDERVFLIDEALAISYTSRDGRVVIVWNDLDGDIGDKFEFVCDTAVKPKTFDLFDRTAKTAQYERKYGKAFSGDESELDEFDFDEPSSGGDVAEPVEVSVEPVVVPSVRAAPVGADVPSTPPKVTPNLPPQAQDEPPKSPTRTPARQSEPGGGYTPLKPTSVRKSEPPPATPARGGANPPAASPQTEPHIVMGKTTASVHLFDAPSGVFVEQSPAVDVSILDMGSFSYWLEVKSAGKTFLGIEIESSMNPVFNYEHLSFIFNYFAENGGGAFSWLLKFETYENLEEFQELIMQALWEHKNRQQWTKVRAEERDYIIDSFDAMSIDGPIPEEEEEDDYDYMELEDAAAEEPARRPSDEDYDDDEEADRAEKFDGKGKNSQLAVGMRADRTFVVRGDKIGVFKHGDNDLEFSTAIDNVATPSGKVFSPKKIMLHAEDRNLLLQNPEDGSKVYNMDLEYGKVVEEWDMDVTAESLAPTKKFSQLTSEQTLLGLSTNGLFRIDPRLSGKKLVDKDRKTYVSKNKFSNLATTESGYIAVASNKGDIRLFDRLGINAKSHLPAMGDPITNVDVSADGKWVLATCATYLLLIDATIKEGKNAGAIGFTKSFGKDSKPRPKRLQISPEHVAFMQQQMGSSLSFTAAHFNTGIDAKEQTIVTSSGPYVVTWSLKKILRNDKEPYLIKQYSSKVTADNFKFGTDRNVIIALEDDVGMVNRRTFRRPTRESLTTPSKRIHAQSRNSIVNSPF